jgi:hypothetical protein
MILSVKFHNNRTVENCLTQWIMVILFLRSSFWFLVLSSNKLIPVVGRKLKKSKEYYQLLLAYENVNAVLSEYKSSK